MEGTVKLGASQLLIDGLENSAMHGILAIQATCPKTQTCSAGLALRGGQSASQRTYKPRQTQPGRPHLALPTTWLMQEPRFSLSHRMDKPFSLSHRSRSTCLMAMHSHWAMVKTKSLSSRRPWWSFGGPKRQCRRAASPVLRMVGWILFWGERYKSGQCWVHLFSWTYQEAQYRTDLTETNGSQLTGWPLSQGNRAEAMKHLLSINLQGTSLAVQWLELHLPLQGVWVLVGVFDP